MISTLGIARARRPRRVLELALVAFALAGVGCGKVGCFEWTEAEGACPSQEEALAYFGSNTCSGEIASVDSEPERSGDYCCYDVTKRDSELYYPCVEPPGSPPRPEPAPQPQPDPAPTEPAPPPN